MSLLAASFGLMLLNEPQQLLKKDSHVWDAAKTSVAILMRNGVPMGQAALIDKSGLFLTNQSAVATPTVKAKLSDGRMISLTWKSSDLPTQTALLQAEDWSPEFGTVVKLHQPGKSVEKTPVIVVLPGGPVLGELTAGNKVAVLGPSRRLFPVGEVRFEASTQSVAGALVFDNEAHLVGLLNATLENEEQTKRVKITMSKGGPPPLQLQSDAIQLQPKEAYGPGDATIGYTVGPEVLHRVISGFLSPKHQVQHPAIGVKCKDAPIPGALIVSVTPNSPASKAGLEAGDIIVKMDDRAIKDQFDFARVIELKDVGDSLTLVITRESMTHTFKITVGTIQKVISTPGLAPGLAPGIQAG
jgi:S1-C subfamily serine protease